MLGIDIEKVERFNDWDDKMLERVFAKGEIEYSNRFKNSVEHLCGFFSVKEAFVKALDNKKIEYKKIEVMHSVTGKPYISVNSYVTGLLNDAGYSTIEISISHCKDYAAAVVLLS